MLSKLAFAFSLGLVNVYKNLISTEKTNKFGPRSWLRKAVLGKTSTTKFQVMKTNYAIMLRYFQIAPPGVETPAGPVCRHINEGKFRQAIVELDSQWDRTYLESRNSAAIKKAEEQNTAEGEEWAEGTTTGTVSGLARLSAQ